jgi:hypothetical protein
MQLKPVAWMHIQGNYREASYRMLDEDEIERGWEQIPLYDLPDTLRVVSVSLLELVCEVFAEANIDTGGIRAIIDKDPT